MYTKPSPLNGTPFPHLDLIPRPRIEFFYGDPRVPGLYARQFAGVIAHVDDDVLLLLGGDVTLPRDVEAASDRVHVLNDGRGGAYKEYRKIFCLLSAQVTHTCKNRKFYVYRML